MRRSTPPGPGEKGFLLNDYPLYNLVRAAAVYNDAMAAALRRHDLSTTEWRILMLLNHKSPSSVSELAQRSVTKMPTLIRMLARMEEEGLIRRSLDEHDRRVVQVTMTLKAINVLKVVQSIGLRVFERAIEGVTGDELERLTATLKKMRVNLERSPYETHADAKDRISQ